MLRKGMDVRSVMFLVGHQNIDTTMKYLAVADQDSMLQQIDQISWANE
jgi:site-specific recombinase XerD